MSAVIAIKKNNRIYMAADTQVSCGERRTNPLLESDRKIYRLDNGILLGITGSAISAQIVYAYSEIFTVPENANMTKKHIVKNIIPKLQRLYKERDMLEKNEDEPSSLPNSLVIAYKDSLFAIGGVFTTTVIEHYLALGNGADVISAGLAKLDEETVNDEQVIRERLVDLLRISESRMRSVSAPFFLIDTERQEFELVD